MLIKDVMNEDFLTFLLNDIAGEVIQKLYKSKKSYAAVVEDGKIVGWITSLDLLTGCKHVKIEEAMLFLDEIKILSPNDELTDELILKMIENEVFAYPVVGENDKIIGTLSVFDILKILKY
ncbi:putative signal transduction protein with CBS domains [Methanococcus vannielii SB]|uniref:Signal transduction protein with CBS domains n=1 Tax=Methanococcus vannielii (strain ATCC 35089 / DSM 1224 / JCM 13029 / OCM 148 / SB) TaxID=406327 RepID=A6UPF7_METVS|nr:CBS domain-containing protein [Methanococcus vannielii]ABR54379.1 putative signal transduction protein with CBS domains [Methanococcus vannielii SB]